MKYSRKIKSILQEIYKDSRYYLGYVKACNECAATDRIIENIIEKSKQLEELQEKRFGDLNKDSNDIEEEIEK